MTLRLVSSLMLLVLALPAWGLQEARLLNQSSSGLTVVFNLGTHDDIREGDYGVIVKQIRSLDQKDLRYVPVGKARNVKINTDSSIWIIYKLFDSELLVKGQKFVLVTESYMLRGRVDPKIGRTVVVGPKDEGASIAKSALSKDHDVLAKKKDKYIVSEKTHDPELRDDEDFDLLDLEEWEKRKGQRYRTALYRSPHRDEFRRAYRLETFHKMVGAYLKRVNDPDFNYESFYEEQMRDEFSNEFRKGGSVHSEYQDFLYDQSRRKTADARLYRTLLEKGETWSEDFSDEELRGVLTNVSVLQEAERKVVVMARPTRYAFTLDYGRHVINSQTAKDAGHQRDARFSLALDFELSPFLRHELLEKITFNGGFRNNKNAMQTSDVNVDLDEISVYAGANWYPLYVPYAVDTIVPFMGLYIRTGYIRASAPSADEVANYTALSMPGLRGGARFNFKNKVGLRIVGSMETLKLEKYETSKFGSTLPERTEVMEGKLDLGVIYAF